jgi:hypothetical protein
VKDWGLLFPSLTTLKSYMPISNPYEGLTAERIGILRRAFAAVPVFGGVVNDEIEIRRGLIYMKNYGGVVGTVQDAFKGPLLERNIDVMDTVNCGWYEVRGHILSNSVSRLDNRLATHVMMTFFVALDGSAAAPLCYEPTHGISGKELASNFKTYRAELEKVGINVVWGSTDGIKDSATLIQEMQKPDNGKKYI